MGIFGAARKPREQRKSARRKTPKANAWIRMDGSFAVRPCTMIDMSESGVRFTVIGADKIAGTFTFLLSRDAGSGRRARVKWRRGTEIGAAFF
jgi:hypothetical protein